MSDRPWQGSSSGDSSHEGRDPGIKTSPKLSERVVLSQEELRVLQECNRESFFYRCVPLGLIFIGTTQILTNKGILKPHPRFGSLFKNIGASLIAYVVGKMSYQSACKEKIMRLPNSALAESLRKGRPFQIAEDQEKSHDMYQPSSDFKEYDEPQQKRSDSPSGYDALRQQNRQEHDRRRTYQQPATPIEQQQSQKPVEGEKPVKRNKYGDVVE